eukprot:1042035-Rhodomonas_salina.1
MHRRCAPKHQGSHTQSSTLFVHVTLSDADSLWSAAVGMDGRPKLVSGVGLGYKEVSDQFPTA